MNILEQLRGFQINWQSGREQNRKKLEVAKTHAGRLIDEFSQVVPELEGHKKFAHIKRFFQTNGQNMLIDYIYYSSHTRSLTIEKVDGEDDAVHRIYIRETNGYWPLAVDANVQSMLEYSRYKPGKFGIRQKIFRVRNTEQVLEEANKVLENLGYNS